MARATDSTIDRRARPRRLLNSATVAWGLCAVICAVAVIGVAVGLAKPPAHPGGLWVPRTLAWNSVPIVFAVPAALIIARQPRNRVGWILMTPAIGMAIGSPIDTYLGRLTSAPPPSVPVLLMVWFQSWSWTLLIMALPLMMLLFPTGTPPTARWRWVQVYTAVLFIFLVVETTFSGTLSRSDDAWSVPNPIGFITSDSQAQNFIIGPWIVALGGLVVASAVALFVRYRRAGVTERLQIKWLLYAAAVFVACYLPLLASQEQAGWLISGLPDLLLALTTMLFPIAIAVAILRYRVWDIDVIINRTLVYVPLTAIVAGLFSAVSSLLQKVLVQLTGSDTLASTILATVVVVATFNPIKDRVQKIVDRAFKETPDPLKRLKPFEDLLRNGLSQLDVNRTTRRFLEEAVAAFEAEGGAAFRVTNGSMQRVYTAGKWSGVEKMGVTVECGGGEIARIALAGRRRGRDYAEADLKTLAQAAAVVSRAIEDDGACGDARE